jgi:YegS/Rv2252/BmrU family lipid kinase
MTRSVPFAIILNPTAASGQARRKLEKAIPFLHQNGISYAITQTEYPRHACAIAESLARNGASHILAAGGDGTAFETINGIMKSGRANEVTFGILPVGTGNSFMRDFGVHNGIDAAKRITLGNTQDVDLGRITSKNGEGDPVFYFHNLVGFGFLADACRLRHHQLRMFGKHAYHAAFFYLLPRLTVYRMQIRIDGQPGVAIETPMLAVCNSKYTGRDMPISPNSNVSDGLFEILYAEKMNRLELLNIFMKLPTKQHVHHPKVRVLRVSRIDVEVENNPHALVDGEWIGSLPFQIENLPHALKMYV